MSGDVCGVSATGNPGAGAKIFRSFFGGIFKIFDIGDVGGRQWGVRDPKPGGMGKIFPIFFWIFKVFDIGDVRPRRGVGDPKGGGIFPIFFFVLDFQSF